MRYFRKSKENKSLGRKTRSKKPVIGDSIKIMGDQNIGTRR